MSDNSGTFFSEGRSVEAVNERMGPNAEPRLAQIMTSLVKHLHAFAKDVELTPSEWSVAIDFLTRTGQISNDNRQEFILLSDVLGLSMLVDAMNTRRPQGATENTVLGPFHVNGAPEYEMGANISLQMGEGAETCLFEGTCLDMHGNPVEGVTLDVWSDNEDGFYDVQQPDQQPPFNNRGVFRTGSDGKYWFRGIKPKAYGIPHDGPVGQMLNAVDRHPFRPAHVHFIVSCEGYETVTTHSFVKGDEYLESDAVFGVKKSLIASYERRLSGSDTEWLSRFDFVLTPEKETIDK